MNIANNNLYWVYLYQNLKKHGLLYLAHPCAYKHMCASACVCKSVFVCGGPCVLQVQIWFCPLASSRQTRDQGGSGSVTIMATKTFISPSLCIYNCDITTPACGTCPVLALAPPPFSPPPSPPPPSPPPPTSPQKFSVLLPLSACQV